MKKRDRKNKRIFFWMWIVMFDYESKRYKFHTSEIKVNKIHV